MSFTQLDPCAYFAPIISRRPKENWYFLSFSFLVIVETFVLVFLLERKKKILKTLFSTLSKTHFLCSKSTSNMIFLLPQTIIFVILYPLFLYLSLLIVLAKINRSLLESIKLFYIKTCKFFISHEGTFGYSFKYIKAITIPKKGTCHSERIKAPSQNCFSKYHICPIQ